MQSRWLTKAKAATTNADDEEEVVVGTNNDPLLQPQIKRANRIENQSLRRIDGTKTHAVGRSHF
jgi:hypothetical protein